MALVEQLKRFVGCRVRVQFWDPAMMILNEAPYPVEFDCLGIVLLEVGGFVQGFVEAERLVEIPDSQGYSSLDYFLQHEGSRHKLAPLADLYQIGGAGGVS